MHVDRLVLFNQTCEQHTQNLTQVFALLQQHQLRVNPEKTRLGMDDAPIMGFLIESGLVKMDPGQLGNFPSADKQYALIVDASTGAQDLEGGLGAILTQMDAHGRFSVIAYASRLLQGEEKNFSPFLLEMRAMVWATRYFCEQLRGRRFILFTDHKPLATCPEAQGKFLTELQLLSLEFDFVIQHKKGSNMPADFLSRSGLELEVHAISLTPTSMADYQNRDPEIRALIDFRATGRWPNYLNRHIRMAMQQKESCFTTNIHRPLLVRTNAKIQVRNLLYAPRCLRNDILKEAHGHCLAGHSAIERTQERITTSCTAHSNPPVTTNTCFA